MVSPAKYGPIVEFALAESAASNLSRPSKSFHSWPQLPTRYSPVWSPVVISHTAQDHASFCDLCHAMCFPRACSYCWVMPGLGLLVWISHTLLAGWGVWATASAAVQQRASSVILGLYTEVPPVRCRERFISVTRPSVNCGNRA